MKKTLVGMITFLFPVVVSAQTFEAATGRLPNIIGNLTRAANALIPFFLAIAVVVFIYGIIKYILATGADDKAVARGYIIYGVIAIAVIVSLFGLIRLLQNFVGLTGSETVRVPQFPDSTSGGFSTPPPSTGGGNTGNGSGGGVGAGSN